MGHRESTSAVNVQIAALGRLSPKEAALCHALGKEAGRCFTDMLKAQVASRGEKKRLSVDDLEKQPEQKYGLHSTCIQGLAQKSGANIATARQLGRTQKKNGGEISARFPYREKRDQMAGGGSVAALQQKRRSTPDPGISRRTPGQRHSQGRIDLAGRSR